MAEKNAAAAADSSAELIADSVADLVRLGGDLVVNEPIELNDGSSIIFVGKDVKAERIPALNPKLPEFVKQAETFIEPDSFKAYVTQFKSSTAICRASLGRNEIVCVLDYHGPARIGDRDTATPGRGAHVVTLQCPWDPDYAKWRAIFGKPINQDALKDFIEDMVHTISEPAAADLLEAISDVQIHRQVQFKSARNQRNGTIKFAYAEEDGSEGELTMPAEIKIVVPIFQGGPAALLVVKLRYSMERGVLLFRLAVPGIEKEEREAFRSIGEHVRQDTGTPVFYSA